MVAVGVSEVKTPGVKSALTSEKREAGDNLALSSRGQRSCCLNAVLGSSWRQRRSSESRGRRVCSDEYTCWVEIVNIHSKAPFGSRITKLSLKLFPLPGKPLTVYLHLPKPDLPSGVCKLRPLKPARLRLLLSISLFWWITLVVFQISLFFPIR